MCHPLAVSIYSMKLLGNNTRKYLKKFITLMFFFLILTNMLVCKWIYKRIGHQAVPYNFSPNRYYLCSSCKRAMCIPIYKEG